MNELQYKTEVINTLKSCMINEFWMDILVKVKIHFCLESIQKFDFHWSNFAFTFSNWRKLKILWHQKHPKNALHPTSYREIITIQKSSFHTSSDPQWFTEMNFWVSSWNFHLSYHLAIHHLYTIQWKHPSILWQFCSSTDDDELDFATLCWKENFWSSFLCKIISLNFTESLIVNFNNIDYEFSFLLSLSRKAHFPIEWNGMNKKYYIWKHKHPQKSFSSFSSLPDAWLCMLNVKP